LSLVGEEFVKRRLPVAWKTVPGGSEEYAMTPANCPEQKILA
jgi:hypothetical protein